MGCIGVLFSGVSWGVIVCGIGFWSVLGVIVGVVFGGLWGVLGLLFGVRVIFVGVVIYVRILSNYFEVVFWSNFGFYSLGLFGVLLTG